MDVALDRTHPTRCDGHGIREHAGREEEARKSRIHHRWRYLQDNVGRAHQARYRSNADRTAPRLLIVEHPVPGPDLLVGVERLARLMHSESALVIGHHAAPEVDRK